MNRSRRLALIVAFGLVFPYVGSYPVLTVNGAYAIRLHEYRFERWWHLYGTYKFSTPPSILYGAWFEGMTSLTEPSSPRWGPKVIEWIYIPLLTMDRAWWHRKTGV